MTDNFKKTDSTCETTDASQDNIQLDKNRRGFLTKAAIVAPVAMVSISKPAWGDLTGTAFRCGISGLTSGNVSIQSDQLSCRGGFSPGYWRNRGRNTWQSEHNKLFCGAGGLFAHCFCSSEPQHDYTGVTLKDIMKNGRPFSGSFGSHAIATYLNSQYVSNYVFTTSEVFTIVNTLMGTGSYTINGAPHDCQQIKTLFKSTYSN